MGALTIGWSDLALLTPSNGSLMDLQPNVLFGTLRALLNRSIWHQTDHKKLLLLLRAITTHAPELYDDQWRPYLKGHHTLWARTTITATSWSEIDLLYRALPWVRWVYELPRVYQTSLHDSLFHILNHPHHTKLAGLMCGNVRFADWSGSRNAINRLCLFQLLPQLTTLDLTGCRLNYNQHLRLFTALLHGQLTTLTMNSMGLDSHKIEHLCHANLQHLKFLSLHNNKLNNRAARDLANTPSFHGLEYLGLKNNKFNSKGKRALTQSLVFDSSILEW